MHVEESVRSRIAIACTMRLLLLTVFIANLAPAAPAERSRTQFALYKMMNRIGVETVIVERGDDGSEMHSAFAFTDRRTTVPLSATLTLGKDGAPTRFAIWGKTSRWSDIDVTVTVDAKK